MIVPTHTLERVSTQATSLSEAKNGSGRSKDVSNKQGRGVKNFRHWFFRGLAAIIGLAAIYIGLSSWEISSLFLLVMGTLFAVYGVTGYGVTGDYHSRPENEVDDLPDPIELTPIPIEQSETRLLGRFPTYWALGEAGSFSCWKWSNTSQALAQDAADKRAAELLRLYRDYKTLPKHYLYSDKKLREAVVKQVGNGVISRNAYGAQILNTESILFADIDFPEGLPVSARKDFVEKKISYLRAWISSRAGWGFRVYRTAAGLRLLATGELFNLEDPHVYYILEELGTDPLYRKLCRVQQTFRARLTPKPWRCSMDSPPHSWPFRNERDEKVFQKWLLRYEHSCNGYAVCRFVSSLGVSASIPEILRIQNIHDFETKCNLKLPLA